MNPASPAGISRTLALTGSATFPVKITAASAQNAIVGLLADGTLKVRIKAPAEKGKANKELLRFLAADFGVAKSQIKILSGSSDPRKLIRIER